MSDRQESASGERLAKVIARAGVCSRRDAESFITAGRVSVNGSPVKTPAFNVVDRDVIEVDGKPISRRQQTQLWLYHKPAGLIVSEKDPEGRPTVFEDVERLGLPRVLSVGRLDFTTEGLLLLTNDGGLKRTLELPSTGWVRRYRVRAFGSVTQAKLDTLANGITVDGVDYGPIEASLDSEKGSNVWLTLGLREGKNREVRNVLGALGLEVNRLIRISYGPFQLGDLPVGSVEKVKPKVLKDQLGNRLAAAAGADFDSPDDMADQPRRRSAPAERKVVERDRFGGLRQRKETRAPEREAEPRTVHFDDGRPSETFIPRGDGKRRRDDEGGDRKPFARREDGDRKPFAKGPRKDDRDFGDRPRRDAGDRPFSKAPRRDDGDRKPFAKGPRRDRNEGEDRPFRKDADRPLARRVRPRTDAEGTGRDTVSGERKFGDRPRREDGERSFSKAPRRDDGDRKPFSKGPRRERAEGEERPFRKDGERSFSKGTRRDDADRKPFTKGPRRERADGEERPFRASSDRPRREDGERTFSKGPRRDDGERRPFAKGPRREGGDGKSFSKGPRREDGERKPFSKGPRRDDGDRKTFAKGPRREGPAGDRPRGRPAGERPGGSRPPRRPRDQ